MQFIISSGILIATLIAIPIAFVYVVIIKAAVPVFSSATAIMFLDEMISLVALYLNLRRLKTLDQK